MDEGSIYQSPTTDDQYQLELYRSSGLVGVYSILLDDQLTLIYGNDLYFKIHGYVAEELVGKSCLNFIHPEDGKSLQDKIRQAYEERRTEVELELRIITGKRKAR